MDVPDRGSGRYVDGQPDVPQRRWQHVLNMSFPPDSAKIGDRPPDQQFEAEVCIIFERDGETWLRGRVTRWTADRVCFSVDDPRLQVRRVWVKAADCRRL